MPRSTIGFLLNLVDIHVPQMMTLNDVGDPLAFSTTMRVMFFVFECNVLATIGCVAKKHKKDTNIYDPQKMNLTDFCDRLTFPIVRQAGQSLNLFSSLI